MLTKEQALEIIWALQRKQAHLNPVHLSHHPQIFKSPG